MNRLERIVEELAGVSQIKNGQYSGIYAVIREQKDRYTNASVADLYAIKTAEGKNKLIFMVDSEPANVKKYTARIKDTHLGQKIVENLNTTLMPTMSQPYFGIQVEVDSFYHARELFYSFFGKIIPAKKLDPDADLVSIGF